MILNHYRSIDSAIKEIENCTFHFAAREELNDPIEGYVRVFWQGDNAAWEGLFRNYICSLRHAITWYLLKGDEERIRHHSLLVDLHFFDKVPAGAILKELGDTFLQDEEVVKIAAFYGRHRLKVNKNELLLILSHIHNRALILCLKSEQSHHLMPMAKAEYLIDNFSKFSGPPYPIEEMERLAELDQRVPLLKIAQEALESVCELSFIQHGFDDDSFLYGARRDERGNVIHDTDITRARQHRNWMTVVTDFPKIYVDQLKDMVYPESYVVCFSKTDNNSVMWGNYADNHRGVCLKYETGADNKLTVRGEHVYTEEVKPVRYGGEIIERNFFETFGRLTYPQIRTWLTGIDGLSGAYKAFSDEAAWRERYWEAYEAKTYRKLVDWQYEEEYRLALSNTFYTFSNPDSRNLRYNPKNLKGVVFGINTSEYDKKRVVEKLMRHAVEYEDFTFYQAEYDEEKQSIRIHKKSLWDLSRFRNSYRQTGEDS